jgi:hypothetical protein
MADPNETAAVVERVAEMALPVLAPFHPLIALVTTAIIAHFNATGKFPTEEQVRAALPVDYQKLQDVWTNWKQSGDGSLPAPARPTP